MAEFLKQHRGTFAIFSLAGPHEGVEVQDFLVFSLLFCHSLYSFEFLVGLCHDVHSGSEQVSSLLMCDIAP